MASTLTLSSASVYALKYRLVSDGSDVSLSQAQLVADAVAIGRPSVIGKLLAAPTTDLDWADLVKRKDFSIYTTLRTATAGASLKAPTPGNRALVVSPCAAGEADIELRFIHSIVQ